MSTQQPVWKCVGHVGDVDPIAHGGGFVYEDTTGVYGPEMTVFEPGSDEDWHKTAGATPLQQYRVLLERDSSREWWYEKLPELASCTGLSVDVLQAAANGTTMERAQLYMDLASYYGLAEFDSYPITSTEDEAYAKYAAEMNMSLGRSSN